MEKRRYTATREPMDLDCFVANFMEDYEVCETMPAMLHWEALPAGSEEPDLAAGAGY